MLRTRNGDAHMKVFVSYSHAQSDWVQDRLLPAAACWSRTKATNGGCAFL